MKIWVLIVFNMWIICYNSTYVTSRAFKNVYSRANPLQKHAISWKIAHHWRPLAHELTLFLKCKQHIIHDPWGSEKYNYTMMYFCQLVFVVWVHGCYSLHSTCEAKWAGILETPDERTKYIATNIYLKNQGSKCGFLWQTGKVY